MIISILQNTAVSTFVNLTHSSVVSYINSDFYHSHIPDDIDRESAGVHTPQT